MLALEGHLLRILVEKGGYAAIFVDRGLTISRIESGERFATTQLDTFVDRPIFDVLPDLKKAKTLLLALSPNSDPLHLSTSLALSNNKNQRYKITALPSEDSSILLLLSPQDMPLKRVQEQLEREKRAKKQALKAAMQARRGSTRFLAGISHEIRTPLNGVIGMTNLLQATEQTPEQAEYTEIIRTSGEALLAVINDILDYAKIEADHLVLDKQPFKLRHCIEECLDIHAAQAAQKNIELVYSIVHPCPEIIISDKAKFMQILNNLISNAVKFSENSDILVSVRCRDQNDGTGRLFIEIQDTGIGIPRYAHKRIFEAFEQIKSNTTRNQGGTGLGLAITKRLVERLGGTIKVKSTLGEGSTFSFDINVECPKNDIPKKEADKSNVLALKNALIVDDNATNRRILKEQLESWGMIAISVKDGAEALETLKNEQDFDLVILDLKMPGLDGLALAEKIRHLSDYRDTPLILLTSVDEPQSNDLLNRYDIRHYLTKPVKQSQLFDILIGLFSKEAVEMNDHDEAVVVDASISRRYPLRILIAEDNLVNQRFIERLLQKMGYTPHLVSNGEMALKQLKKNRYDLILMDIQLSKMDGVETAKKIRQLFPSGFRPQIIALTAHAMPGDREKYLQAGMNDYLSKPLKINELVTALQKCATTKKATSTTKSIEDAFDAANAINMDYVRHIASRESEVDDVFIRDLLQTFIDETAELWRDIQSALESHDFPTISRAAHTIKSSSQIVGAQRFGQYAEALAAPAISADYAALEKIVQEMRAEKDRVLFAVQKLSDQLTPSTVEHGT